MTPKAVPQSDALGDHQDKKPESARLLRAPLDARVHSEKTVRAMKLGPTSLWGIAALVALGCSSGAPSSSNDECASDRHSTDSQPCTCSDGRESTRAVDHCTGSVVTACACSTTQACVGTLGCKGKQACTDSTHCAECRCDATDSWKPISASGGRVVHMSTDGKGKVALLLNNAPWLASISVDGQLTQIPARSALNWAGQVWAAPNGTFVALSAAQQLGLQFQRFDVDGSLVGSGSWSDDPKGKLEAIATRPDGRLALMVSSDTAHTLLTLSDDDELKVTASLAPNTAPEVDCCDGPPKPSFIVSPGGDYLLAGKARPDGQLWWAKLDDSGKSLAVNVANDGELTPLVALTNAGVLFGAYTANGSRARLVRLGQKLEQVWATPARDDQAVVEDLVALPDGALLAARTELAADLIRVDRLGNRFDRNGDTVTTPLPSRGNQHRLLAIGDYDIVMLEQSRYEDQMGFTVSELKLSALPVEATPSGSACETDADCSSAHCCFQGSNHVGKCGDTAGCELNEQCTHDDQCASGKCLLGVAVCSVPCTQSKDCPANTYCAEACSVKPCISVCLPECVGKNAPTAPPSTPGGAKRLRTRKASKYPCVSRKR